MSEETKKKISEALKKGYGQTEDKTSKVIKRSPEAQKLQREFDITSGEINASKAGIDQIKNDYNSKKEAAKNEIDSLKDSVSGSKDKGKKAEVKAKIKAIKEKLKAEKEAAKAKVAEKKAQIKAAINVQKGLKAKAIAAKNIKKAQETIKKAQENLKKTAVLEKKATELFAKKQERLKTSQEKGKDVSEGKKDADDKLDAAIQRIKEFTLRQNQKIRAAEKIISAGGIVKQKGTFEFSGDNGDIFFDFIHLYERKPFVKHREFTLLERRVNFPYLNEEYNDLEGELEHALQVFMNEQIEKNVGRVKNKIQSGDLTGIASFSVMSAEALAKIILVFTRQAFEVGKKSASEEMGVPKLATSRGANVILNFEANEVAINVVNDMNSTIRQRAKEEIVKKNIDVKLADVEIGGFVDMEMVKQIAERLRRGLVGSLIGQNINKGRRFVFDKNATKIKAYQRTEYLDFRICPTCKELNGKYVSPDDPFSKLDKVHNNCRGFWMPVLGFDTIEGKIGLPKKITNAFDLLDGFPITNEFKQIKKSK